MAAKNLYVPPSQKMVSLNSDEDIQEENKRRNKLTSITDMGSLESGTTRAGEEDGKRVVDINEAFELSGGFGRY